MASFFPDAADPRLAFERRMSVVYGGTFFIFGVFQPFFPVWLADRGLDENWIGVILAMQIALRVAVTGPVLRHADRRGRRGGTLVAAVACAALATIPFHFASGAVAILLATMLFCALWAPLVPLADAIALTGVGRFGVDYGRARLWGSVAFIAANVAVGYLFGLTGAGWFPWILTASFALSLLLTLPVPRVGHGRPATPVMPDASAEPPAGPVVPRRRLRPAADLAPLSAWFLAISLIQASHAMLNGFASIHWLSLGYTAGEIGVLWAVGVLAEVALFRFAAAPMRRLGVRRVLVLVGVVAVLRWLLFTVDIGYPGFLLLQTTHALTFAATLLSLQVVIAQSVPEPRYGAAQAYAFVLQTATTAVATLAGGYLFAHAGAPGFAAMALLAGSALAVLALAPQPQRAGSGGNRVEPS